MPAESFYEDLVIDTPEAWENFLAFLEEEPHMKINPNIKVRHASEETMKKFMEKHLKKDRSYREWLQHILSFVPHSGIRRCEGLGASGH